MKKVASLRYGVIFKKAFSNPDIFKAFVKDFIGIELVIDKVETEKSFDPQIGNVDTRFDLFAEDKKIGSLLIFSMSAMPIIMTVFCIIIVLRY